jgi:hypothetical protein
MPMSSAYIEATRLRTLAGAPAAGADPFGVFMVEFSGHCRKHAT